LTRETLLSIREAGSPEKGKMAKTAKRTRGPYISSVEAARMLSISPDILHLLTVRGVVTPARMSRGQLMFARGEIERFRRRAAKQKKA
jgi:hypothetical protein